MQTLDYVLQLAAWRQTPSPNKFMYINNDGEIIKITVRGFADSFEELQEQRVEFNTVVQDNGQYVLNKMY